MTVRNAKGRGKGYDILGEFKSNLPEGDHSIWEEIYMDKFLGWGWILPGVGAGYKVCQSGPLCEPSWALGARTHVVLGSASTEISSVNGKSLWEI